MHPDQPRFARLGGLHNNVYLIISEGVKLLMLTLLLFRNYSEGQISQLETITSVQVEYVDYIVISKLPQSKLFSLIYKLPA